jgi:serine/threonine-protein kinase PpkA
MASRILIVDDDEDVIALLRHHLVGAGYEVVWALDGFKALQIAVRESPDLIVSDVRMPEFDGFGLLAALRANATTRAMPFIFLTVLDDPDSLTRAMRLGVDGYLPKPVDRDALLETVASKLQLNRNRLSVIEADSVDARDAVDADDELLAQDFALRATERESRHATVVYSDIRRFTRIAEILSHHETADLLRDYYAIAADIIRRQRGAVVKFIGDALLASFDSVGGGAADHAACATRAAILLSKGAAAFGKSLEERYPGRGLPKFAIGVGIHTGDVMVCSIGPRQGADVTVVGDTVNIAARLESATKRLGWEIVASDATVRSAGDHFVYGRRSLLVPRGRFASVEVREVKGFAARADGSDNRVVTLPRAERA